MALAGRRVHLNEVSSETDRGRVSSGRGGRRAGARTVAGRGGVMTFIWLIVWLIFGTPAVQSWGPWNNWGTALFVCLAIDLLGALGANSRRPRR